jgi:hypothetical protein
VTELYSSHSLGPLYVANRRFGPQAGARWSDYIAWSGLMQLGEVVGLDEMLCPPVLDDVREDDWPHIVNESFMLNCFTDLAWLLARVLSQEGSLADCNILCVHRNPQIEPELPEDFDLLGYDLVDVHGGVSVLTNCGGYPDQFAPAELNRVGLLNRLDRARALQKALPMAHPDDSHAVCHVWAVGRWNGG